MKKVPRVRTRPGISHAPAFGLWVLSQRGQLSLEDLAVKIRPYVEPSGLQVDRSTIKKIEQGRLPSWPMVGALAIAFGIPTREVIDRLISAIEFPGVENLLPRDTVEAFPSSARKGSNGTITPTLDLLHSQLRERDQTIRKLRRDFSAVIAIAAEHLGPVEGAPRSAEPPQPSHTRTLRPVSRRSRR